MSPRPEALARYRRQITRYRNHTAALLIAAWDDLPGYDEADLPAYIEATATPLRAGKASAVALSAAFFSVALRLPAVGVDPDEVDVEPDIRGPFRATWHALSMGRGIEEAVRVGRSTAQSVGFDFVQSAARRTGDTVADRSDRRVRWARVPTGKACDWCQRVASDHYLTAESADFGHERDDCDVVPVL